MSHRVARSAAADSQRCFDIPASFAPSSIRLPKLPSRSSRFAWMPSRSALAAATAEAACSRVIAKVMGQPRYLAGGGAGTGVPTQCA